GDRPHAGGLLPRLIRAGADQPAPSRAGIARPARPRGAAGDDAGARRGVGPRVRLLLWPAGMNRIRLLLLALPLLAACAGGGPAAPSGPTRAAGYPGFDTSLYPGDAVARAWRQESPYRWIGYYLPAPC